MLRLTKTMTKLIPLIIIPIRHSNFILICCLLMLSTALSAQTIVNREWVQSTGTPDETIDWQASVLDANDNILTTSNTVTTGQAANIYTYKIDKDGNKLWEREYNHSTSDKDYGAAITTDAAGNVYVAGAVTAANGFFDYMVLKYAANGTLLWTATHNGASNGHDVPVAVGVDGSGNVYVSGGSENGTALVDYCTIKYNSNGNQQWISHYDYNNLYDAPVALQIDMSGDIVVTGASADNILNWESATVKYDAATGTQTNAVRVTQTSGIHEPTDFDIDLYGNFYIVGNTITGGTDHDIRTIKLSPELNIEWVEDYDGAGFEDGATTIDVDVYGNVFVGGYTYDANGAEHALIIEYDEFGMQVSTQTDNNAQSRTTIKDIRATDDGVLVTGGAEKDGTTEMFVRQYDSSGNLVWQDTRSEGTISLGNNILVNNVLSGSNNVLITGVSTLDDGTTLTTTNYNTFTRPTDVVTDTDGNPLYMDRMVIVRFHKDVVRTEIVDNPDIIHGRATNFLTVAAINELNTYLSFDMNQAHLIKVFKQLKSTHTTSISRLGEPIPIPDFWTTFIVVPPEPAAPPLQESMPSGSLMQVARDMERATNSVRYAHMNRLAKAQSNTCGVGNEVPDDTEYSNQHSLYSTSYPNGHVNAQDAWGIETGEPFIRVGVLDEAVYWGHEDLKDSGDNSVLAAAWDFEANEDLIVNNPTIDDYDWASEGAHGTAIAGIIGAARDNAKGIAGIAGGCDTESGVSLYSLRIAASEDWFDIDNDGFYPLDYIAEAIIMGSMDESSIPNAYALHVMNMAYQINERFDNPVDGFPGSYSDESIQALSDAIHFANRNQVVFVASAGNDVDFYFPYNREYPSDYNNNWIVCVGGTNQNGDWLGNLRETNFMDMAAPAQTNRIRTIWHSNQYSQFGFTSGATPHVSGAAALLLSYVNVEGSDYNNLSPEDVEYVLRATADAGGVAVPNTKIGYGLLQIHDALEYIEQPMKDIMHFGTMSDLSTVNSVTLSSTPVETNVPVIFKEPYENLDGVDISAGDYTVDVYAITADISHQLTTDDAIIASWGRHSSSTPLQNYAIEEQFIDYSYYTETVLRPHEEVRLISVDNNKAIIEGYVHLLTHTDGTQTWIPRDPNTGSLESIFNFEYSILVDHNPNSITDQIIFLDNVSISPNPGSTEHTIIINANSHKRLKVDLYDVQGIHIQSVYDDYVSNGENRINVSITDLPAGMYFYRLNGEIGTYAEKFIKL